MLSEENIIEIFENFKMTGFDYSKDSFNRVASVYGESGYFSWCQVTKKIEHNEDLYNHFLTRVIESINERYRNERYLGTIKTFSGNIVASLFMLDPPQSETFELAEYNTIDEAKEAAIEYVLEKIKDNK
jgi:hypothetical protein